MKASLTGTRIGSKIEFAGRVLRNRWFVVVAAIWIQCCSGSSYNFGLYSQAVKTALNYDQRALNTLATFKDLGANAGIVSGFVFDYFSPAGVLFVGALQSGFGYLMLWLFVTGRIAAPQFWQTCFFAFMAANGQTYFNTACVVTCVHRFPYNRGIIIGLMKGFLGLSGAILTQLYHAIYPEDEGSSFLILVAWLPSTMALLMMPVVRPVSSVEKQAPQQHNERSNLYLLSAMALAVAAFLMVVIVEETIISFDQAAFVCVTAIVCGMLVLPTVVAVRSEFKHTTLSFTETSPFLNEPLLIDDGQNRDGLDENVTEDRNANISANQKDYEALPVFLQLRDEAHTESGERDDKSSNLGTTSSEASTSYPCLPQFPSVNVSTEEPRTLRRGGPRIGEHHTFVEASCTADFWIMFMAVACGMGSGLTVIDNMGQIGASLGYTPANVGTCVSLLSIWNFLGRIGVGALSDFGLRRYKLGRPMCLVVTQIAMVLAHLLLSTGAPGSLYVGSTVIGLCYGAQWSVNPAITSEIFGLARFATLFNTVTIASPIGVYFLSVQIAGRLYDIESRKEHGSIHVPPLSLLKWFNSAEEELDCNGSHCFRLTFLILAAVSLLGCSFYMLLARRTSIFYRGVISASMSPSSMETRPEMSPADEQSPSSG